MGVYKAGACSSASKPRILCHAVQHWPLLQPDEVSRRLDAVQSSIWTSLQHGSVAVHCLSGAQRAACIIGCHYLWRYYCLGHTELPGSVAEVFQRLQSARTGLDVNTAYADIMETYRAHLQKKASLIMDSARVSSCVAELHACSK